MDLNKEIPFIYLFIYIKIKEKNKYTPYIKPKDLLEITRRICRIPRILHYPIIFQMCECKLLKRINHQKYQILKLRYDPDEKLNKLRSRSFWD